METPVFCHAVSVTRFWNPAPELCHSGGMGVQTAVHGEDLACHVVAFVAAQVHAEMTDVFRSAVSGHTDVVQIDFLQCRRDPRFVLRCHDQPRTHAVAADVVLAVLQRDGFRQHIYTGFGRRIGRALQITAAGSHGPDVDNGPAVFRHERQCALHRPERAPQVAVKNVIPLLQRHLIQPAVLRTGIGRIVDQHVDSAVFRRCVFHQSINGIRIHEIHEMIGSLSACIPDFLHHRFAFFLATAADDHLCSFLCIQLRNPDADPAGGSGYNSNFALQSVHNPCLLFFHEGRIPQICNRFHIDIRYFLLSVTYSGHKEKPGSCNQASRLWDLKIYFTSLIFCSFSLIFSS